MSVETVRAYLQQFGKDQAIRELDTSSATVELAAQALGVEGARIAKTLSLHGPGGCILVVTAGDRKINSSKFKARFGVKAKMLTPEEALAYTGHAVGGVCPFGITNPQVSVYLDESLQRFDTVFPAAGSSNSAIELTCQELVTLSQSCGWVDVCAPL